MQEPDKRWPSQQPVAVPLTSFISRTLGRFGAPRSLLIRSLPFVKGRDDELEPAILVIGSFYGFGKRIQVFLDGEASC